MKEDYLITIHGTMEQDGESDSVKLMTRGSFVKRNGSFFISYKETEATGYAGQLVIEKGRRHVCHYETGHGSLSLGVAADEIHSRLSDEGGTVRFSYLLDMDTAAVSRNIVKITVKPAN